MYDVYVLGICFFIIIIIVREQARCDNVYASDSADSIKYTPKLVWGSFWVVVVLRNYRKPFSIRYTNWKFISGFSPAQKRFELIIICKYYCKLV